MSDNVCSSGSGSQDDDEPTTVTLYEVLEQQKKLEEEYAAVLGGSDEKECTYEKGYIKRQALYSCLTCCPEARTDETKAAGVCLACTFQCHENHELIELYTKRNFRCDCPTERISQQQNKCNFMKNPTTATMNNSNSTAINDSNESSSSMTTTTMPMTTNNKFPMNKENSYNQNFSGLYCTCKRPYPDPDDPIQDEMIQCIICEDWYHTRHLDVPNSESIPKSDGYSEMICGGCMEKCEFLADYTLAYAVNIMVEKCERKNAEDDNDGGDVNVDVDAEEETATVAQTSEESVATVAIIAGSAAAGGSGGTGEDDKLKSELDKSISNIMSISKNSAEDAIIVESVGTANGSSDEPCRKKMKLNENMKKYECRRPMNEKCSYKKGAIFWSENWRHNLCSCAQCQKLYVAHKVEFLLDKEDTVHFYEENGLKKSAACESDYEQGIRALSTLGRVQQIEAITEYNKMKDKLMEFLRTFVVNQKVVTEADIHGFFQEMKNEKNTNLGIPHFCR